MKRGKFFSLPEGPSDIERLWHEGRPLNPAELPAWLSVEDASQYRCVGSALWANLSADERVSYFAELEELEAAGLIADPDPSGHQAHCLYLAAKQTNKYDIWSVGIYIGDSPFSLTSPANVGNPRLTREHVTDILAIFVADPFMVRRNATWYMFLEAFNWRTQQGEIGLATSPDGLTWTYQHTVVAEPFHLSYPYVFAWMGDYYMVPECHETGSIRLYKAREFPWHWSLVGTLLDGLHFADPSIFRYRDKWWLFTETNPDDEHDTLRLYSAGDLLGPWTEHPRSPIIHGNARAARPAGRVLVTGQQIIRYAQDCYPQYGTAVRAFEVTELTATTYVEREVTSSPVLMPGGAGWNASGMHHIDAHPLGKGKWIACVDGWRRPTNPA